MATATSATASNTDSVDDLRRRMAQIRQRLHQDMQGVVAGAEAASDWKHYVRIYPWAALGVAFAAGFLIVPRRRRSVTRTAEKAAEAVVAKLTDTVEGAEGAVKKTAKAVKDAPPETKKKGLIAAGFSLLVPVVWKFAQNYALGYVENWIAMQQQMQQGAAAGAGGPMPPPSYPGPGAGATRRPGA